MIHKNTSLNHCENPLNFGWPAAINSVDGAADAMADKLRSVDVFSGVFWWYFDGIFDEICSLLLGSFV